MPLAQLFGAFGDTAPAQAVMPQWSQSHAVRTWLLGNYLDLGGM